MVLFEFDKRTIKKIIIRFALFGLPLVLSSFFIISLLYTNELNAIKINIEKQQEEIVQLYKYSFESLIRNTLDDLNVVSRSDEIRNYLENDNSKSRLEAGELFARVLNSKHNIYQLRVLSLDGMEIIRTDRNSETIKIIEESGLQNKKDRNYFQHMAKIEKGSMYISDFDLNVENGKIEIPYKPTIRFALPLYFNEKKVGFIIANLNGLHVLEVFKEYEHSRVSELNLGLLDKNNLITLDTFELTNTLETTFIMNEFGQNPLHQLIDYSKDRGRFKFSNENYYYNLIKANDPIYDIVFDETWGQWAILSSYNELEAIYTNSSALVKYPNLRFLLLIPIFILALIIIILITSKETEHLLLMATGIVSDFSHDAILITNNNKRIIYCNKVFEMLFGYNINEIKGKSPKELLSNKTSIIIDNINDSDIIWEGNIWDISADGIYIQRYLRMRTVRSSNKQIEYYIGIYSEPRITTIDQDIMKGHISKTILNVDTLDYLPPLFQNTNLNNNEQLAVITLRITEYAILRNMLTEVEENSLVVNLSSVIKKDINTDCSVFSPSAGLIFIAVTLSSTITIEMVMENIDKGVSSMRFTEKSSTLDYLSGVAIAPGHGENIKELIENSYIALDAISRIKNMKYLLFNQDIFEDVQQHYKIKNAINKAYINNEFTVVYQPQNKANSREMVGVEALVRWNSSTLGNVPSFTFVTVMEEDPNQIKKLGKYVLNKVVTECKKLLPLVCDDFRFSVNLSSQEFSDLALIEDLIHLIHSANFPPERICFEITETVLSENLNQTNNIISILHRNKITVAIDDFGTGYSSLGYLKKLNADKLKVDMIFIRDYPDNDDGTIIKAITKLSHEMGVKVIVEGIETEEQLTFINDLKCQEFQGYLSSKPVPVDKIKKLLEV